MACWEVRECLGHPSENRRPDLGRISGAGTGSSGFRANLAGLGQIGSGPPTSARLVDSRWTLEPCELDGPASGRASPWVDPLKTLERGDPPVGRERLVRCGRHGRDRSASLESSIGCRTRRRAALRGPKRWHSGQCDLASHHTIRPDPCARSDPSTGLGHRGTMSSAARCFGR